jgi:nitrate reductase NapE
MHPIETEPLMDETSPPPASKSLERKAFLLLAVVMGPVLAVVVVSGYGFLVWMYQLLAGPPGPRL